MEENQMDQDYDEVIIDHQRNLRVPLFVPITPPKLVSLKKSDILTFLKRWNEYEQRTLEAEGVDAVPMRTCIDDSDIQVLRNKDFVQKDDHKDEVEALKFALITVVRGKSNNIVNPLKKLSLV